MKRVIAGLVQLALFLVLLFVGSLLPVFHVLPMWSTPAGAGKAFVWDGVVLAAALYLVLLAVGAARRRLASAGVTSTGAFVLALVLGLLMKFGFVSAP